MRPRSSRRSRRCGRKAQFPDGVVNTSARVPPADLDRIGSDTHARGQPRAAPSGGEHGLDTHRRPRLSRQRGWQTTRKPVSRARRCSRRRRTTRRGRCSELLIGQSPSAWAAADGGQGECGGKYGPEMWSSGSPGSMPGPAPERNAANAAPILVTTSATVWAGRA